MDKKISIVIPAYNAEKTVEKCINSVTSQSYDNLEIIVVNDGSKDSTEKIVSSLAEREQRVKLISIPNGGVVHARNIGICNASGDYITFVDSDDTIDQNMYETLIKLFQKYNADIVHCSYKTVQFNGKVIPVGGTEKEILQSADEAIKCLITGRIFASGLWNKLYKRDLFLDVKIDESIKFNEDCLMNFELFRKASSIVYVDIPFYNYNQFETSATHTANHLKSAYDGYLVSQTIYSKSIGTIYEKDAKRRLAVSQLGLFGVYSLNKGKVSKSERKSLEKTVVEWKNQGLYNKNETVKLMLYRFLPRVYKLSFRLYDKIRVKKLDPKQ